MQMWHLMSSPRVSVALGSAAEPSKVPMEVGLHHTQKQQDNFQPKTLYVNALSQSMRQVPYQAAGWFSLVLGEVTLSAVPTTIPHLLPSDLITTYLLLELRKGVAELYAKARS